MGAILEKERRRVIMGKEREAGDREVPEAHILAYVSSYLSTQGMNQTKDHSTRPR